jgi:3-oxocholest-4-en-26-oate---CoA ligase
MPSRRLWSVKLMTWNLGDILDQAATSTDANDPAIIFDDRVTTWGDFQRRASALATAFQRAGAQPGDKIAFLSRNHPAYVEGLFGALKARLVHVNVNFRYRGEELKYILQNSDSVIVVYGAEFAQDIAKLKQYLPLVRLYIEISDAAPQNKFATRFEDLTHGPSDFRLSGRSPDDFLFVYTGGTTGLPKAVMWTHGALWSALGAGAPQPGAPPPESLSALGANIRAGIGRSRILIAPPLIHGTGLMMTLNVMGRGGSIILGHNRSLDAQELLRAVDVHQAESMVIVGDVFARPMVRILDANPGAFNLSSLKVIVTSGAMCSPEIKTALLNHNPGMVIMDALGASEALGVGMSTSSVANVEAVAKFQCDPTTTKILTESGQEVVPGSGVEGRLARSGFLPLGYYKDAEKTAQTYVEHQGVRYAMAGDWATVEADGSIRLLGRGSQSINTGGEKVYPEEVEEVLKTHPDVDDALVVGLPDETWGQAVTAVIEPRAERAPTLELLRAHVKTVLAGYKAPKQIVLVEAVPRGPNGKADYKTAKEIAMAQIRSKAT